VTGDKETVDGQCLLPIGNWCEKRKKVLGREVREADHVERREVVGE
jgi:hypothetical protein